MISLATASARRNALKKLKELWKGARNGVYFVKRGAVNWGTFDFDAKPRAVAILVDRGSFLRINGINYADVAFEICAQMRATPGEPEIDDELLDELIDDAERVIYDLQESKDKEDNPVVLKVSKDTAEYEEFHDVEKKIQGIIVKVSIEF